MKCKDNIIVKILLIFATDHEAECIKEGKGEEPFRAGPHKVSVLVTGVGSVATAWALKKWLQNYGNPDLAINAGIAGTFNENISIGEVVMPVSDCFADLGIETDTGFVPLKDTYLMESDKFPFSGGNIICDNEFTGRIKNFFRPVRAVTVNMSSGSEKTIERLKAHFNPDIETMEGAAFFYVCSMEKIPFIALRAISNRVGAAERKNWNIPLAINNLSEKLKELLTLLQ